MRAPSRQIGKFTRFCNLEIGDPMTRRLNIRAFYFGVMLLSAPLQLGVAQAEQSPRAVTIGSNPAGTVFYAVASAFAKVVSEGTSFQMTVQPYTGTSTFLPLLNSGEIDFGVN